MTDNKNYSILDIKDQLREELGLARSMACVASDSSFGDWSKDIREDYFLGIQRSIDRAMRMIRDLEVK